MRKRKAVSLNLEKRRIERTALSHGELERENDRRTALGEESLDDAEDITDLPDAVLTEASQITADLVQLEPRYLVRAKPGS
jgi:hypothetical protein